MTMAMANSWYFYFWEYWLVLKYLYEIIEDGEFFNNVLDDLQVKNVCKTLLDSVCGSGNNDGYYWRRLDDMTWLTDICVDFVDCVNANILADVIVIVVVVVMCWLYVDDVIVMCWWLFGTRLAMIVYFS